MDINLLKILEKYSVPEEENENTGAGAVAGFSAPMGDDNSIVKKKTVAEIEEGEEDANHLNQGEMAITEVNQEQASEKTFNSTNFEITRAYRGPSKGQTLMIRQVTGNADIFKSDEKVKQVLNYIETII